VKINDALRKRSIATRSALRIGHAVLRGIDGVAKRSKCHPQLCVGTAGARAVNLSARSVHVRQVECDRSLTRDL
jgi:hypothetical protein